jgi:hypothetical protein
VPQANAASGPATNPTTNARKYSVNAVATAASAVGGEVDCTITANWNESVAAAFGLSFTVCPRAGTSVTGLDFAAPNAKVADIGTQIDNFLATQNGFSHADVVTVMGGLWDILEQYALYPATPKETLKATLADRGKALAQQINRVAITGAPVIVVRMPRVGETPYGRSQSDGGALLNELTDAFNTALQLNLINDGHLIGLVFGDAVIQNVVNVNPNLSTPLNITTPVCQSAVDAATAGNPLDESGLLQCTASNLVTAAAGSASLYLWAGNVMFTPLGQTYLGNEAVNRAVNNPF